MTPGERGAVAVVGSGAAGIAAAFRLHEAGFRVRLIERNDRLGGRMRTVRRDGFVMEQGATSMPRSYTSVIGLAEDAGLDEELVPAGGVFTFPGRDGSLHEIDTAHAVRGGVTTKLVPHRAKLRLLRLGVEILRYQRKIDVADLSPLRALDGMTADEYGRRLMGDDCFDHIAAPALQSLTGCAPADISAVDLMFVFGKLLSNPNFVTFRGGMQSYAELMASRFDVQLGARVVDVSETTDRAAVRWFGADGMENVESFDGIVLACDANVVSAIHRGLDPWRREFLGTGVRFSSMTACSVAVDPAPPTRASLIFPSAVHHPQAPMVALEHNIVGGRAPVGKGIVTLYPTGEVARELYDQPDDVVAKTLIDAAAPMVPGLPDSVLWATVWRHDPCVMQSRPGYWTEMKEFRSRSTAEDRRIRLAGDYFAVSNLNSASTAGERAARDLIEHLAR